MALAVFVDREGQASPGGQDVQFSQPTKLYSPGLHVSGRFYKRQFHSALVCQTNIDWNK